MRKYIIRTKRRKNINCKNEKTWINFKLLKIYLIYFILIYIYENNTVFHILTNILQLVISIGISGKVAILLWHHASRIQQKFKRHSKK